MRQYMSISLSLLPFMQKKSNPILSLLILFLFLYNSMGYYLIFELNKYRVKKEIQSLARMNPEGITILEILNPEQHPDFNRPEENEIIFRGKRYDVVKETREGKTVQFHCKRDYKEETLLSCFTRMNHSKFSQELEEQLIKIAWPLPALELGKNVVSPLRYPTFSLTLCSVFIKPLSLPPESVQFFYE